MAGPDAALSPNAAYLFKVANWNVGDEKKDVVLLLNGQLKTENKAFETKAVANAWNSNDLTKDLTACVQAAALVATASQDLTAGLGYVESGRPGVISHLHNGGETVWLAYRHPIPLLSNLGDLSAKDMVGDSAKAKYVMAGGSVTYQHEAVLVTGDSTTPLIAGDVTAVWLGVEGFAPTYRGAVEVGYTDTHAHNAIDDKFSTSGYRWEVSGAYKVLSTTWVGLSYGTARGTTTKLNDHTLMLTLQFATPPAQAIFGKVNSGDGLSH